MPRFFAGFFSATVLWAGVALAYAQGYLDLGLHPTVKVEDATADEAVGASEKEDTRKRRRRPRRRAARRRDRDGSKVVLTGENLGENETRRIQAGQAGGEEQLVGTQIERGVDSVFPRIRRCLLLVSTDQPVTGKLVFGMRITGEGRVSRVNLKGPSAITRGESGSCLRKAAKSIDFPSFNGPDMVVHYPVTLE